jgi:hypothetical protein
LKKILEDIILNGKVEFTLGEVLGIANREFHEVIMDIIKRKHQTFNKIIMLNAQGTMIDEENINEETYKPYHLIRDVF